jgi:N utilization substance protein B
MGKRRRGREIALLVLTGIDFTGEDPESAFERFMAEFVIGPEVADTFGEERPASAFERYREVFLQGQEIADFRVLSEPVLSFRELRESVAAEPAMGEFARALVRGVAARREEIDALIAEASEHWRLDRMAVVDRNLLRLATYELIATPDVPTGVVLNEAIDLARTFGTEASPAFVNGVLDRVAAHVASRDREARRTSP